MSNSDDVTNRVSDSCKYQAELKRFVEQTKRSEQESINGEAKPLDLEALRLRIEHRLANRK